MASSGISGPRSGSGSASAAVDPNRNEVGHYVVTAHKPGAVLAAVTCSFLGPNTNDLVLAKSTRIEIRQCRSEHDGDDENVDAMSQDDDGNSNKGGSNTPLPLVLTLPLNGRISSLTPVKLPRVDKDYLFVTTERGKYCLISYEPTATAAPTSSAAGSSGGASTRIGRLHPTITHASGSLTHHGMSLGGREAECGPIVTVDPAGRCLAVHSYDGYVTVFPINRGYEPPLGGANVDSGAGGAGGRMRRGARPGPFGEMYHCRIEERTVLHMTFLHVPLPPPKASVAAAKGVSTGGPSASSGGSGRGYMPQLALLHQDARGRQHLVAHSVDLSRRKLVLYSSAEDVVDDDDKDEEGEGGSSSANKKMPGGPAVPPPSDRMRKSNVDGGSAMIVPVPCGGRGGGGNGGGGRWSPRVGGVLILGQKQITYHAASGSITKIVPIGHAMILSCCRVVERKGTGADAAEDDGVVRYLLGDETGTIHLLALTRAPDSSGGGSGGAISGVHLESLGSGGTVSSALGYLGSGLVFVGSQFGDSKLVRILDEPVPVASGSGGEATAASGGTTGETTCLKVLEEYTNLGPIVDFDLVPTAHGASSGGGAAASSSSTSPVAAGRKHQQSQVVTASGVGIDGSIRLVRNGIGMRERAAVGMEGIKGMWNLRAKFDDKDDSYLVQGFVGETRVLGVAEADEDEDEEEEGDEEMDEADASQSTGGGGDEAEEEEESDEEESEGGGGGGGGTLEEVFIPGFDPAQSTLYAGNVLVGDTALQITEREVRLVKPTSTPESAFVDGWTPPRGEDEGGVGGLITVASANESGQIVVAVRGGTVFHLAVVPDASGGGGAAKICKVGQTTLDREISCIDLHPFEPTGNAKSPRPSSEDMDVDDVAASSPASATETIRRGSQRSDVVAVGLWDDFTVRLLSLPSDPEAASSSGAGQGDDKVLQELLCIKLGASDDVDDNGGNGSDDDDANGRHSRQHMMARSLCLVTLDSSSLSLNVPAADSSSSSGGGNKVNMLLVGLGDGKLVSFAVAGGGGSDSWSVHARKEVSLGTQGIHLVPFHGDSTSASAAGGGTCVLATGDRPTVVYLTGGGGGNNTNPKLCYSNVSLAADDGGDGEDNAQVSQQSLAVNVAAPFRSSLLFSAGASGDKNYSLCVADESTLRLGIIDDIQKLHVATFKLGMTPRRIAHHEAGRVYCVGCVGGASDIGGNGDSGSQIGGEANMANCVRFFDDSTFEEIDRIDLEPFEMILSLISIHLRTTHTDGTPGLKSVSPLDQQVRVKPYVLIGTAYAYPDEDEPTRGRIIVVECNTDTSGVARSMAMDGDFGGAATRGGSSLSRAARQVTQMQTKGGVYSMCPFYDGSVLVTINSKTQLCQFHDGVGTDEVPELKTVGAGHHGHILSLFVKSLAGSQTGTVPEGVDGASGTQKPKTRQLAIVGDIMRSISVVEYNEQHQILEEVARDYNANWCTAVEMLTNDIYLGGENWNNLFVLRRNVHASSEEVRVRLDTVGEFHLAEMPNKFMGGSLIMPSSSGGSASATSPTSESERKEKLSKASKERPGKVEISIGSQSLFATVDGTIGSVLGLDASTTAFLSTLQRAMVRIVRPVGDLSHDEFRAFEAERRLRPSRGFIDGDLVESFLDLDHGTMEHIVRYMNEDGRWQHPEFDSSDTGEPMTETETGEDNEMRARSSDKLLSVADVLAMVEEMSMLH